MMEDFEFKTTYDNCENCPYNYRCNKNLCPLDGELDLRTGDAMDKCQWSLPGKKVMPDKILKFVPKRNIHALNEVSRKRWDLIQ